MIKDFKFHMPAPVYFGHETVKNNADLIASYGKKCYITTTHFPEGCENAALNDFISVCEEKGIEYLVNEEVVENPTVESCVEMTREARAFGADFFAGIGGGSSMDTAKAVSVLLTQSEDVDAYDFFFKNPGPAADPWRRPYDCKPVICVPTTAGSGSEVTGFYVLTRSDTDTKDTPAIMVFAAASLLDPKYLKTAPQFVIDTGAMDALSHGIETSLNVKSNYLNRAVAKIGFELFRQVKDHLLTGEFTDDDYDIIMLHSCVMGIAFYQAGTLIPHGMGYYLSHHKGLNHGLACSITEGEYLRCVDPELVKPILEACGFDSVDAFADYVRVMTNRDVHMTVTNAELEAWSADFVQLKHRLARHPGTLTYEDVLGIYQRALAAYLVD